MENRSMKNRSMKNRNIPIFALGRLVSLLGTYMYQFAAGLYVLKITGSGTKFALTLILGTLPRVILAPFAGVIADRISRKKIVVISDLLSGLILVGALLAASGSGISVNMVYVTMVALTICNTFFDIAIEAAKPTLVSGEVELEKINALSYGIHSFTSIVGPVLGGVVYALMSFELFVLVNGISFILSAGSEMLLKFRSDDGLSSDNADESFIEAFSGGINYLKNNKFSIILMSFSLSINFCLTLSLTVPLPYLFNNIFKLSPTWVGISNAGFPAGYLIGTLIINARSVNNRGKVLYKGIWTVWIAMALIAMVSSVSVIIGVFQSAYAITVLLGFIGFAIAYIDIPLMTFLQMVIPNDVRGRVFSVMTMASRMAMPAAMLLSGQMLNVVHPAYLIMFGTGIYLIVILTIVQTVYFREYIDTNTIKTASVQA